MATMSATTTPQRPPKQRTTSMMSWGSHKSSGSKDKIDLTESPKDKARRRMNTKADPLVAMREAQPAQVQFEKSTMDSLRAIQHRDHQGNVIADPDRSNPTRHRLERPLDTIRSFEAAIDGKYSRDSPPRPDTEGGFQSRRSSYFFGVPQNPRQRFPPSPVESGNNGGWQPRPQYGRPDSYHDNLSRPSPPQFRESRRPVPQRSLPEQNQYGNENVYGNHRYQQSYETNASGSGTEPWATSTNPSSENSSLDRVPQPPPKHEPQPDNYGFNGFGDSPELNGPIFEEQGRTQYGHPGYQQQGNYSQGNYHQGNYQQQQNMRQMNRGAQHAQGGDLPPPPPPHDYSQPPRGPSKMHSANGVPNYGGGEQRPAPPEKRKSWLKRRFSKNP